MDGFSVSRERELVPLVGAKGDGATRVAQVATTKVNRGTTTMVISPEAHMGGMDSTIGMKQTQPEEIEYAYFEALLKSPIVDAWIEELNSGNHPTQLNRITSTISETTVPMLHSINSTLATMSTKMELLSMSVSAGFNLLKQCLTTIEAKIIEFTNLARSITSDAKNLFVGSREAIEKGNKTVQ
ncbi:hypothetical protein Scep_029687 [Stephania cephalantha]|uniref:Uncharacterized protein n=1 Tax=Stephania cephalantha TaxID=152367 RepID=A0AAP0DY86_9MAGN